MKNDIIAKLTEARQKLPLKTLMERRGRGPTNGNWKSFNCPYCEGDRCAGVFAGLHGDLFKCHHTSCRSLTSDQGAAWDEIGFLSFEHGCDRRAATRIWLEEARLWDDQFKSALESKPKSIKPKPASEDFPDEATEPATDSDEPSVEATAKSPVIAFYEALELSEVDREELKTKRGLSDEIIDASGFRTNHQSNLEILRALSADYDEWLLVKCGLWTNNAKQRKPSGQFYGYGVIGKKKKLPPELLETGDYSDLDDDDFVWDWKESGNCNPIIIPYFNLKGELIALRPHKGFPRGQQPRLYLAGGANAVKQCKRAVIVEGEFKAAALQSVLGNDWAVASVPGITQVKNFHVWGDILGWLKALGVREVVVSFDNEEQSNPALPYFKPQFEDRYESEVWARVCAIRLSKEGYAASVAHLPDDWRNEKGKADWDSVLAGFIHAGKSRGEIVKLFTQVLQNAQTPVELVKLKLCGEAAERSIANRVAVRTYEPALPWGGGVEQRLGKQLRHLAATILPEWKNRILFLAEAYEKTAGHYYELKLSEQRREKLQAEFDAAESFEQVKFLKLALKGIPSLIAPFRLIPCYVLVKPDGTRVRLVKLQNIRGEYSGMVALDSNSFTAPRDFRRWLTDKGGYSWHGGERQLQALQQDIDFTLAFREVVQLVSYGCEHAGQLWVVDDCAYAPDGTEILPDRDGIFWYQGKGYKFLRVSGLPVGEEDQTFRMKIPPQMQPNRGLVFDKKGQVCLQSNAPDDSAALQELLGNFVIHLNDSYGGHDGAMLIAATTAFYAAPELFAEYAQFPGLWITGEKGSGKTYTAKWLMGLHGVTGIASGLSFKTSTAVGMQIALGQYANLPVWGDEFKETELRDSSIIGVIHGGFNREVATKWSVDGRTRTIRTSLLITGESTCSKAATMSRFISTIAAREKRAGTHEDRRRRLEWLQQHQQFFFAIGRMILRNRAKFSASVERFLKEWEQSSDLVAVEPRTRFAYGVSYASFLALNELISVYNATRCAEFRLGLVRKTIAAAAELAARTDVVQFFELLINAIQAGVFGKTAAELKKLFKHSINLRSDPPLSARQLQDGAEHPYLAWKSGIFFFQPGAVIQILRRWLNSQGLAFPLEQSDLLEQLRSKDYWVPPPSKHGHQQKFGAGATKNRYCWAIDLDKFPELGLLLVTDEVWIASLHPEGDTFRPMLASEDWIDPRRGPLFAIVDGLEHTES